MHCFHCKLPHCKCIAGAESDTSSSPVNVVKYRTGAPLPRISRDVDLDDSNLEEGEDGGGSLQEGSSYFSFWTEVDYSDFLYRVIQGVRQACSTEARDGGRESGRERERDTGPLGDSTDSVEYLRDGQSHGFYQDPNISFAPGFSVKEFEQVRRFSMAKEGGVKVTVGRKNVKAEDANITIKDYSPRVFADIRKLYGISTEMFMREWDLSRADCQLSEGAGRSGSLFMFSKDRRFLMKTIPQREAITLRTILPHYHRHLTSYPKNLLMKFFALHRFKAKSQELYVVVFDNVIFTPPAKSIRTIWDLKGRKPKPGKIRRVQEKDGEVLKDKDLNRLFQLDPHDRSQLVADIRREVLFMKENNLMDYSFLIGTVGNSPAFDDILIYIPAMTAENDVVPINILQSSVSRVEHEKNMQELQEQEERQMSHSCSLCDLPPFPGVPVHTHGKEGEAEEKHAYRSGDGEGDGEDKVTGGMNGRRSGGVEGGAFPGVPLRSESVLNDNGVEAERRSGNRDGGAFPGVPLRSEKSVMDSGRTSHDRNQVGPARDGSERVEEGGEDEGIAMAELLESLDNIEVHISPCDGEKEEGVTVKITGESAEGKGHGGEEKKTTVGPVLEMCSTGEKGGRRRTASHLKTSEALYMQQREVSGYFSKEELEKKLSETASRRADERTSGGVLRGQKEREKEKEKDEYEGSRFRIRERVGTHLSSLLGTASGDDSQLSVRPRSTTSQQPPGVDDRRQSSGSIATPNRAEISFQGGTQVSRANRDTTISLSPNENLQYVLRSFDGTETYYFGMIDFLAEYQILKKSAHFFKSFLWRGETLSTVPADYYASRMTFYLTHIIHPKLPTSDPPQPQQSLLQDSEERASE